MATGAGDEVPVVVCRGSWPLIYLVPVVPLVVMVLTGGDLLGVRVPGARQTGGPWMDFVGMLAAAVMVWVFAIRVPRRLELLRDGRLRLIGWTAAVDVPLAAVVQLTKNGNLGWHLRWRGGWRVVDAARLSELRQIAAAIRAANPGAVIDPGLLAVEIPAAAGPQTSQRLRPVLDGSLSRCPVCRHVVHAHPQPWRDDVTDCAECLLESDRSQRPSTGVCRERFTW
ncbi:MAG TPA: hypothetical protein VFP72_18910 [Kineosporiaceae bacterium]|nr:hypothetical protein [Kineosporiaceae bacterium]